MTVCKIGNDLVWEEFGPCGNKKVEKRCKCGLDGFGLGHSCYYFPFVITDCQEIDSFQHTALLFPPDVQLFPSSRVWAGIKRGRCEVSVAKPLKMSRLDMFSDYSLEMNKLDQLRQFNW